MKGHRGYYLTSETQGWQVPGPCAHLRLGAPALGPHMVFSAQLCSSLLRPLLPYLSCTLESPVKL